MAHREFKDALYTQFARIGQALASPKRIELLDLLAQGEKTVELLAEQSATPIKNTSAHLRALRQARLVDTRREGTYVYYRVADDHVVDFVRSFEELGRRRLTEVAETTRLYIDGRDTLAPVTFAELKKLMRENQVTVIDVRPRAEFEAGHIPGALSIPAPELARRAHTLPRRKEVVAYCRGPYCVYSVDAVTLLRQKGFRARRTDEGLPEWRSRGFEVIRGEKTAALRTPPARRKAARSA